MTSRRRSRLAFVVQQRQAPPTGLALTARTAPGVIGPSWVLGTGPIRECYHPAIY